MIPAGVRETSTGDNALRCAERMKNGATQDNKCEANAEERIYCGTGNTVKGMLMHFTGTCTDATAAGNSTVHRPRSLKWTTGAVQLKPCNRAQSHGSNSSAIESSEHAKWHMCAT